MYRIRIPIGILLISFIIGVCYLDYSTKTTYATSIVLALFIIGALWEFYQLVARRGYQPYQYFALLGSISYFTIHLIYQKRYDTLCLNIFLILLFVLFLKDVESEKALENSALTLLGFIYVHYFLGYLILTRELGDAGTMQGVYYLLMVILVSKSMDIGGYLVGKAFGKHKIAPKVSPKKSVEGTIGGLVLAIATTFAFQHWVFTTVDWKYVLLFALIIGCFSLLGDLAESLLKRRCDAKDSNQLIPEFGGILDLVDSMTFTAPLGYYLIIYFWR